MPCRSLTVASTPSSTSSSTSFASSSTSGLSTTSTTTSSSFSTDVVCARSDRRQLDLACQSHRQSHGRRHRQDVCRSTSESSSESASSSSSSASNVMRKRCNASSSTCNVCRSSCGIMLVGILGWIIAMTASTTQGIQQISDPYIVEHPSDLYVVRNEPATLNCKAEGRPPPIITWYRDRQLVTTSNENSASHRMVLPSGQLFIMKVSHKNNKLDKSDKQPDVGEYYCNATNPETRVSSISRVAKLEVAVIKDDFREQPQDLDAAVGLKATLHCKPPHGEPDPEIRWEKDRSPIELDDRVKVDKYGSLHISDARKDDSGTYQCIAANIAGERESRPARLSIKEKPVIIDGPKNSVVKEGGNVLLQCHATGDPELVVSWRKKEGEIRTERSILADRSLQIHTAQVSDEGTYVCRVENTVGWQEAEAKLTVHSRPSFIFAPRDKVVGLGRRVSMRCEVTGSPAPGVYWTRVSDQTLMLPNKNHGRFRVTEEGTLIIESVRSEDAGEYACRGESLAGTAYAKARLDIKDVDPRPPPIISVGPQNQTLPTQDSALLPCTASGEPAPGISWLKNGVTLSLDNPRFTIVESGTLQISDLQQSDSGLYTCKAVSETGETTWTASLMVEPTTNLHIIFHRNQEPNTFPGPPTKPVVSDVAETTMRLTWRANQNTGASAVVCYVVEYFSHETGEGWVVLSDSVTETSVVVRNLQPNTSYMFLARAKNSHGLSQPSPVTSPTRTKGDSVILIRPTPPQLDLTQVADKLSVPVVRLWTPEILSSTAVKLTWEVQRNQRFIEGYYVKYRATGDRDDAAGNAVAGQADLVVETVQSPVATLYILSGLQKYASYEIRLQPFYSTVKGVESNTVRARTLEDVPSAPPRNIRSSLLDNKTLILHWEPPPRQHRNGVLYGYKIYIYGNESKFNHEVQVNATVESAFVSNVLKEVFYKLYMTAYNRIGEGVRSEVIYIGQFPGELTQPLLMEPWFIATLVATVGAAIWLALCLFSIWIYRRRTERKKGKKNRAVTAPIHRTEENGRTGNIPNQIPLLATNNGDLGCRTNQACMPPCCYDNKSPSDGESKANGSESQLNHTYQTLESLQRAIPDLGDPLEFPFVDGAFNSALPLPPLVKGVYNSRGMPPLPYATATLMGNGSGGFHRKMSTGGTIPNPEAYMIQPNAPSCDSFGKREGDCQPDYGTLNLDDRMRGSSLAQQLLYKHPVADHVSQSSVNTYQSDRARSANGGGGALPKCPIGLPNDFASYGLPAMCSDCDQRQYDSPCDRLSSLDSQASMTPFSNSYHNTPPAFLPDPMLLTYDAFNGLYPGEKAQDCSDLDRRSVVSSDDAEVDFANAVSRVAELSGLTIASSNGMQQYLDCKDSQKAKKSARHRQRAPRPSSPCSTDSSYSAAPRRPYPKSDRKKHIQDRVTRTGTAPAATRGSEQSQMMALNNNRRYNDLEDILGHPHSSIPYSTVNSSSSRGRVPGNFGPALACSTQAPLCGSAEGNGSSDATTSIQPSLLLAFDTRNTPIV